jgi:multimeric flavodoxin WrbA
VDVRTGQGSVALSREEFERRIRLRFYDPAFEHVEAALQQIIDVAWDGYHVYRKWPRTLPAGAEFADPEFPIAIEWLETRRRIQEAEERQRDPAAPTRVLLICGAARHDKTCPGEMSKTFRLCQLARTEIESFPEVEVDFLDLALLTAEYGRFILPCKACVSTAMPLCHWPCSCYPNHAMGQVQDWMSEIYPRWAAAHGVLIVTPVYWYQAPSVLKLMIDRLVCADGGNPDPTTTRGKTPELAKALELRGWNYPKHLAGRVFNVIVHGDADGVETLRRSLTDWLTDLHLIPADGGALGRYIGYFESYALSHEALDHDQAIQQEVKDAAQALLETVKRVRSGHGPQVEHFGTGPRPK